MVDFFPMPSLILPYWNNINRNIYVCSEEEDSHAIRCASMGPHIKKNVDKLKLSEEGGKDDEMP